MLLLLVLFVAMKFSVAFSLTCPRALRVASNQSNPD